ncbi:MAG: methyltransferase domain-containing protein [Actinomycetota bacterium]|nr:methyltransferase domain-containing protein [Actinomycetota bacterium]
MWDPGQYARFATERARPFGDLVARVSTTPARVVDLGCGPGTLTRGLADRWPDAVVTGIDSSEAMWREAGRLAVPGRLEFLLADLTSWAPDAPVDLVVANAVLHWVPGHVRLLGRLSSFLSDAGALAFQVPANHREPSHTIVREVLASQRWTGRLGDLAEQDAPVAEPRDYLAALLACGLVADVWETTYLSLLAGEDPVLEWLSGTALRPALARLDRDGQEELRADLAPRLRHAYPAGEGGTVLPYRRIFAVGSRRAPRRRGGPQER